MTPEGQAALAEVKDFIEGLQAEIERVRATANAAISNLEAEIDRQESEIERLRHECEVMDKAFTALGHQLADAGREIERLQAHTRIQAGDIIILGQMVVESVAEIERIRTAPSPTPDVQPAWYRMRGTTADGNRFDMSASAISVEAAIASLAREHPGWIIERCERFVDEP